MFCPCLENLVRKGLTLILLNSLLYTFSSFSSYAAIVILIIYFWNHSISLLHCHFKCVSDNHICEYRDHFVNAPSQWETMLYCHVVCHWLGAYTKWSLWIVKAFAVGTVFLECFCHLSFFPLYMFNKRCTDLKLVPAGPTEVKSALNLYWCF